jgi:hypothetical protein
MNFSVNSILAINGNKITDHNRKELNVGFTRIETRTRMVDGRMRKYWIADKHTFDITWNDTPFIGSKTVDGFWSIKELESFYYSNPGSFAITITDGTNTPITYTVVVTDISKVVRKRFPTHDRGDFTLKLEEV